MVGIDSLVVTQSLFEKVNFRKKVKLCHPIPGLLVTRSFCASNPFDLDPWSMEPLNMAKFHTLVLPESGFKVGSKKVNFDGLSDLPG